MLVFGYVVLVWRPLSGVPLKGLDLLEFCSGDVVLVECYESGGGGNRTRVRKPSVTASTCFSGEKISPAPDLPGRARSVLARFKFRQPPPPGNGGRKAISHRGALVHHRERVMGGRWPVIRRPELLHNRWRLCVVPLFYEAGGALGMQLQRHEPPSKSFRPLWCAREHVSALKPAGYHARPCGA